MQNFSQTSPKNLAKKLGILGTTSCFILLSTMYLTACGQKGDLYLPDSQRPTVAAPQAMPADTSEQPNVTGEAQNPNITSTKPTDPQTTAQPNQQDTTNDY